jgi:hypothetical protein
LELLHHYCNSNTSLASSIGLSQHDGPFALPSVAFRFEFVLRAILALAALHLDHLQSQRQDSTIDYTAIAASHINDALPAYQSAVHGVTQESCTALLMFSSLLTVYVLAVSRNGMSPSHRESELVEHKLDVPSFDLVSWIRLVNGGITAVRPWIRFASKDADIGTCLNPEIWTIHKSPKTSAQAQRDKNLARLERLWNADADGGLIVSRTAITDLSTDSKSALTGALNLLRKTYVWVTFPVDSETACTPYTPSASKHDSPMSEPSARASLSLSVTSTPDAAASTPGSPGASPSQAQPVELSAILAFLHGLNDVFLLLLQRRHPLSLIVMAHYAVVLQQQDVWWLRGLGQDMHAWVVEELLAQPATPDGMNYGDTESGWMRWIEWSKSFFNDRKSIDPALADAA